MGGSYRNHPAFPNLIVLNTVLSQQFRTFFHSLSLTGLCQKPTLATGMISLCFNKLAPGESLYPSRAQGVEMCSP